jgi:hypothetical protein
VRFFAFCEDSYVERQMIASRGDSEEQKKSKTQVGVLGYPHVGHMFFFSSFLPFLIINDATQKKSTNCVFFRISSPQI